MVVKAKTSPARRSSDLLDRLLSMELTCEQQVATNATNSGSLIVDLSHGGDEPIATLGTVSM